MRNVRNAFYDLMYAIGNLNVQRQSLELAQQSLKDNRARVEIGTMAPLDIVQAEAEVATREEAVIIAEAAIERQQDMIRALVFNPKSPDFWTARIEPTETVRLRADDGRHRRRGEERAQPAHRPRRRRARTSRANDVNIRYFDNQSLPDLNASVNYGAQAIGGVGLLRGPSSGLVPGPDHRHRSSGATGTRSARCSPAISRGGRSRWTWPIRSASRTNEAQPRARPAAAARSSSASSRASSSPSTTQVRDAARNVQTNAKRVDATRSSRVLAERRLEAEEKKYQAGMTQNFFVLQAQRDLNVARNNELLALVEYAKSVVNYSAPSSRRRSHGQ